MGEGQLKQTILIAAALLLSGAVHAQTGTGSNPNSHAVSGYTRNDGTYVQPHTATNPNGTQRDNYGATGNVNPTTGQIGTRTPQR
jgi:hypothetical protein